MNENLNKRKIEHFYQHIIDSYSSNIKELYWGNKDEFIESIYQIDSISREEYININCKNVEEIRFSQPLFDFLFKGDNYCMFDCPIGQRYEYDDYIFIELLDSPIINISKEIEKAGIFPITKNGDSVKSCFLIRKHDYPKEIIPFFVSQMKYRLETFEDTLPSNFIDHFKHMKYVLRIEKGQDNLLIKLLYKLTINLGIIENVLQKEKKITIQQEIQSIIDDENNLNLTNDVDENLDSLRFYISAIRNPNSYYRFLDAYHVFESLFHKHFYNYIKHLDYNNISKDKLCKKIKDHLNEQQMLKLVLASCLDNKSFYIKTIKEDLLKIKVQELAKSIGESYTIEEWPTDDAEKFASKLSTLIYAFRNAIAHSTEFERHIEKIEKQPSNLTQNFLDLTNLVLEIAKYVLENDIEKW